MHGVKFFESGSLEEIEEEVNNWLQRNVPAKIISIKIANREDSLDAMYTVLVHYVMN